jgi:hypothetical protein
MTIGRLLIHTPLLQVFEYDCFLCPDHVPLDLGCLREALLHIRSTLTSLTVRYELYNSEYLDVIAQDTDGVIEGSLGPLHDFPILANLVVSLPVLFGTNADRHPSLSAYFPPALEHLTITVAFQCIFEDVHSMAFFRAYLSGEKLGSTWMGNLQQIAWTQRKDNWNIGRCY